MDAAIGIGEGGGDEDFSRSHEFVPYSKSALILANRAHWRRIAYTLFNTMDFPIKSTNQSAAHFNIVVIKALYKY